MLTKTCHQFIDELGSTAPVPGGGSASALVGAIGISLGTMAGVLTSGKKKFEDQQDLLEELIASSRQLTAEMEQAVQKDVTAFEPLAAAYRMPSSTEEEKARRQEAIQDGLLDAAEAPLHLAELCVRALRVLEAYSHIDNCLVISDVGTGTTMCRAALEGARLNVITNLRLMKQEEQKIKLRQRLDAATEEGLRLAEETYRRVEEACS